MRDPDHPPAYCVTKLAPGYDLRAFDCGEPTYDQWLLRHAAASMQAGVSAVYMLIEANDETSRVVGYYAINPTQVVRDDVPKALAHGWSQTVPAWKLGKLVVHIELRAEKNAQLGRQLLRDALETIVRVADAGAGKVIVVDADNERLLDFYIRNGFKSTGRDGELSLYMKVSTARAALDR